MDTGRASRPGGTGSSFRPLWPSGSRATGGAGYTLWAFRTGDALDSLWAGGASRPSGAGWADRSAGWTGHAIRGAAWQMIVGIHVHIDHLLTGSVYAETG